MTNLFFHFCFSMFSVLSLMVLPILCRNFTTDELTLLAFKFSVHDPRNHLANWSSSSSFCNWTGVTCDVRHERIRILNLAEMGLNGTLPSQIGDLSFLEELDLQINDFHGVLPKELLQLHKLKILNLSHNGFNGEVPIWIGSLVTLQHLILLNNSFGGVIPPSVSNLSKLETLDLAYNFIEGSIPLKIGKLQRLRILRLSHNKLSGRMPSTIFNLSSLERIYLIQNSLSGNIPNELGDLTNLKIISLSANKLSGHIPRGIGNLTMLQGLYLDDNNLEGLIPLEVGNLYQLEILELMDNKLSGSIPEKIFNISSLKRLSLANNSLSGSLPLNFGCGLPSLHWLLLWGNQLSGIIPNTISNASKLTYVSMETNYFRGIIPSTLGDLRNLGSLIIYDNNLTIIDASNSETSILSSLTRCRNLVNLYLSMNPLYIKLPKSIGNFSNSLQVLSIFSSSISGNIPSEIGNLTNLITLSLEENVLSGTLPITIGSLQSLQLLDLQGNELHGLIIQKVCKMKRLAYLYLSRNKFVGAMPSCIGNLTSLQELFLDSNKLNSDIPISFGNLKDILKVNFSSNILVGNISFRIGNLKALTLLDLSRNQISGIIPPTISGLQSLQILSLAINKLQGYIPESFGDMLSLESLDLSQNNLSGEIPKSLESLVYLKFVNLSYNKLQGQIPSGGVFKNLTADSFMMNEALCGKPQLKVLPCKKGSMKRSMVKFLLLKCILPIVMSTILAIPIYIIFQCKRQNSRDLLERDLSTIGMPRRISYFEIVEATNGFDESNLLGKGSYGSVFKGKLQSGMMVAIKIFNFDSEIMSRSFEVECNTLRNVRHRNLVKIISSCSNLDFKSLIMEFMPNGSLEKWLYSHNYCLDFLQRLNAMINVASALEYLHYGMSTPVIHCDLKPSNILLDDNMVAHVSDFGMSKLLDEEQSKTYTNTIPTIGYIAPEYGSTGVVSTKVDVYSYGILLIEVFTRKTPTEDMFVSGLSLQNWVNGSMPHAINEVIDSNLLHGDEQNIGSILTLTSSIFELALNCCGDSPETRRNMADVVVSLNNIKILFLQRQHHM